MFERGSWREADLSAEDWAGRREQGELSWVCWEGKALPELCRGVSWCGEKQRGSWGAPLEWVQPLFLMGQCFMAVGTAGEAHPGPDHLCYLWLGWL